MLFIGVDLAWSENNPTGMAIFEGDKKKAKLLSTRLVLSDKEIIDYITESAKNKDALIAIDAPLIVPNEEGRRIAEEEVGYLFRKYNAGAHPANRRRLSSFTGKIRGEEISKLLEKEGFKHDPKLKKFEKGRKFFEVYPHPSIVVLFNLDKILQYKAKPKRDYEFRWKEFKKYQKYMKDLEKLRPSFVVSKDILNKNVKKLKGKSLKNYEDILDAIFCSYIAYYSWANPEKCEILGNMKDGYILTPVFGHMKKKLEDNRSQRKIGDY